jgi:hypothetical protein
MRTSCRNTPLLLNTVGDGFSDNLAPALLTAIPYCFQKWTANYSYPGMNYVDQPGNLASRTLLRFFPHEALLFLFLVLLVLH